MGAPSKSRPPSAHVVCAPVPLVPLVPPVPPVAAAKSPGRPAGPQIEASVARGRGALRQGQRAAEAGRTEAPGTAQQLAPCSGIRCEGMCLGSLHRRRGCCTHADESDATQNRAAWPGAVRAGAAPLAQRCGAARRRPEQPSRRLTSATLTAAAAALMALTRTAVQHLADVAALARDVATRIASSTGCHATDNPPAAAAQA